MTFIRSRIGLALIGLIIIGGLSAVIAIVTTPQPYRAALALAGQTTATTTATGVATATATAAAPGVTVAPTAPSTTSAAPPALPTTAPISQGSSLNGTVASIDTSAGTFTVKVSDTSAPVTVVVTSATNFQGAAKSLSALRTGWQVEVQGASQANGTFLASDVNSQIDN